MKIGNFVSNFYSVVLAGLLLIRSEQKVDTLKEVCCFKVSFSFLLKLKLIFFMKKNDIYDYLSGIAITSRTKYFNLNNRDNLLIYQDLIYFFDYAAASYGWPMYLMASKDHFACFKLLPKYD